MAGSDGRGRTQGFKASHPDGVLVDHAAIEFVAAAFAHNKAIGFTAAAQPLLDRAGVAPDERIVPIGQEEAAFFRLASGRQWDREAMLRPLP